ncbi:MAG: A/G-specific adenine glycosylase [Lachnospiraceae bacterium]|nr:A/G-specific adenine glycosylase [Lachnospiraceae bacterium]MBR0153324.1 A/G-specific adenine glycosylase [Lachnospiraceae bacterium]
MRLAGKTDVLLSWYHEQARSLPWREDPTPYHIWVSEIMLQQTRIEAVRGYYRRFLDKLPDIRALAGADEETYLKLWEGLGYYHRVRNMHKAAVQIEERFGGEMPGTYEELLTIPGIGPYTAAAIASIGFGECVPCVDGNVLRVTKRLSGSMEDISKESVKRRTWEELRTLMEEELPDGAAGDFNQALMELGEVVCVPNGAPHCEVCPLSSCCAVCREGNWAQIPYKAPKKARRIEERTVFVLKCGGRAALRKRPDQGLLAGLWELPAAEGHLAEEEAVFWLRERGLFPEEVRMLPDAKHVFSHVEWRMRAYEARFSETAGPAELLWTTKEEREGGYALASAFDAFRESLDR